MNQPAAEQHPAGAVRLGCPVWACSGWVGSLYRSGAARDKWLGQYSEVFGTVEGNSTFYGLPDTTTADRWARSVQPGFRFCLKLPRIISHDLRLTNASRPLQDFLRIAEVLRSRGTLGPTFIQLPPDFSAAEKNSLQRFLEILPAEFPWSVEVRHPDWFDKAANEQWLVQLLSQQSIDFVLFDSRPLFSAPPTDQTEEQAAARKPRTPLRTTVTGQHPFLRLICRNRLSESQQWIREWAEIISGWLQQGLQPYVFTHSPDDQFAPLMADAIHRELHAICPEVPEPPEWPGRRLPPMSQGSLF
jgi:uncharacterized protein YecE (DUF72 family)